MTYGYGLNSYLQAFERGSIRPGEILVVAAKHRLAPNENPVLHGDQKMLIFYEVMDDGRLRFAFDSLDPELCLGKKQSWRSSRNFVRDAIDSRTDRTSPQLDMLTLEGVEPYRDGFRRRVILTGDSIYQNGHFDRVKDEYTLAGTNIFSAMPVAEALADREWSVTLK